LLTDEGQEGLAEKIYSTQQEDPEIRKIAKAVINGNNEDFSLSAQGILYRTKSGVKQLVIPRNMQGQVIQQAHPAAKKVKKGD